MSDLFVSYGHEDTAWVKRLVETLKARGLSVWWDDDIRVGDTFRGEIKKQLHAASCVIVVWSRHSVDKTWVHTEAQYAAAECKLAPISIDDCVLPLQFDQLQTLSLNDWQGRHPPPAFERLIDDVGAIIAERADIVSNNQAVSTSNEATLAPDPPGVLPYLADRGEQAFLLHEGAQEQIVAAEAGPLLFFLPGTEDDKHHGVLERFVHVMLPSLLADAGRRDPVHLHLLDWPSDRLKKRQRLRKLRGDIAKLAGLGNPPSDGDDGVLRDAIDDQGACFVGRYNLYEEQWSRDEQHLLEQWVEYWRAFPPLRARRPIILFFCFYYREEVSSPSLFSRLFGRSDIGLRDWLESHPGENDEISVRLPDLQPLAYRHVMEWATTDVPNHYHLIDRERLEAEAVQLLGRDDSRPLGELLAPMREALKRSRT